MNIFSVSHPNMMSGSVFSLPGKVLFPELGKITKKDVSDATSSLLNAPTSGVQVVVYDNVPLQISPDVNASEKPNATLGTDRESSYKAAIPLGYDVTTEMKLVDSLGAIYNIFGVERDELNLQQILRCRKTTRGT